MSELRTIADEKITAERGKIIASLPGKVDALKAKNAAAGVAISGYTMQGMTNIYAHALESLRDVIIEQYGWAISEAIFAKKAFTNELIHVSAVHVAFLHAACVARFKGESWAPANAVAECKKQLDKKNEEVCEDIRLALSARLAEKKRRWIRNSGRTVADLVSKVIPKA